jgi:hypothetical protein
VDEFEALLAEAGKRGFLWYMFRSDLHGPAVVAGVYQWPGSADVFVLVDQKQAHAYRVPTGRESDVFDPDSVLWWYGGCPVWTLRALLALPEPCHPEAPGPLAPAPCGSGVQGVRVPVRMRRRGH